MQHPLARVFFLVAAILMSAALAHADTQGNATQDEGSALAMAKILEEAQVQTIGKGVIAGNPARGLFKAMEKIYDEGRTQLPHLLFKEESMRSKKIVVDLVTFQVYSDLNQDQYSKVLLECFAEYIYAGSAERPREASKFSCTSDR